ncbi:hypothetical protein INR49_020523, partial [Caranx melampygus]
MTTADRAQPTFDATPSAMPPSDLESVNGQVVTFWPRGCHVTNQPTNQPEQPNCQEGGGGAGLGPSAPNVTAQT